MAKTEKNGKEGKSAATEISESPIEEATPRSVAKADAVRSTSDILDQIFLADDLIPDPAATFSAAVPSVEEAVKTANIVLDTNVLLLPYGAGSSSLVEIIKALKVLADKMRWPPETGQVAKIESCP